MNNNYKFYFKCLCDYIEMNLGKKNEYTKRVYYTKLV